MFREFKVGELFDVTQGRRLKKSDFEDGDIPFVMASSKNNGVVAHLSNPVTTNENFITADILGNVFYHDGFVGFGDDNCSLKLKKGKESEAVYLYLVSVLSGFKSIASYGNKLRGKWYKEQFIKLPVKPNTEDPLNYTQDDIDWDYMESTIRELEESTIRELDAYLKETGLDDYHLTDAEHALLEREPMFCAFGVGELFKTHTISKKLTKAAFSLDGRVPVYSSDTRNNGVLGYTEQEPTFIVDKSKPTYLLFGDHTRTINIAHQSFCIMDNVKVLSPKFDLSDEALLYIKTVWLKGIPVLGYARHWSVAKDVVLFLPVKPGTDDVNYTQDDIDWDYMASYVRVMEKRVIADVVDYKNEVIALTKDVCHK